MIKTILDLIWSWFKKNIKLPFDMDTLKSQGLDVAYNQGLPALMSTLEEKVPAEHRDKLNHPMWQAAKTAVDTCGGDPEKFVQHATTALQNSGQMDEIIKHVKGDA
jgi:hypothetical protein